MKIKEFIEQLRNDGIKVDQHGDCYHYALCSGTVPMTIRNDGKVSFDKTGFVITTLEK